MWFCPTCRSALQSALKKVEALSAENVALREEVREVRQAVEPTGGAWNNEVERISPVDCNSGVNSSRSCPAVCEELTDALHPLPPKPKEAVMKEAGHPRENNPHTYKNMAQRHSNKRHIVPDDLPEIRFLRNVDKSLTVEQIEAALRKARVHTDDCFIEQTVPQEEFRGLKKFVRIILPNRIRADEFAGEMKRNNDFKWQFSRKPPIVGKRESSKGQGTTKPTSIRSGIPPSNHPSVLRPPFLCSGPPHPRRPPLPPQQLHPGLLPPPLMIPNLSLPPHMIEARPTTSPLSSSIPKPVSHSPYASANAASPSPPSANTPDSSTQSPSTYVCQSNPLKLKIASWNVCGWSNKLGCNFRESVIRALDLDIICVCETFLIGDECINIEGFHWIGNNRKIISCRALRGSGGVGILIRDSLADNYSVSVLDSDAEGILWVQFTGINHLSEDFSLCVCYLPPSNSSRGDNSVEFFDQLKSNVYSYHNIGTFCICGDFNARCGCLQDSDSVNLCNRLITDHGPPNGHGKSLIDFLKCADMCMLNGRSEQGNGYTSVSPKGLAVVDYCLVPIDAFTQFTNFKILDILDVAEEFSINLPSKIPDHSLLTWDLTVSTVVVIMCFIHMPPVASTTIKYPIISWNQI